MQSYNFKKATFGGYRQEDVLNFINQLVGSQKKQIEELTLQMGEKQRLIDKKDEKICFLLAEKSDLSAQAEELTGRLAEQETTLAGKEAYISDLEARISELQAQIEESKKRQADGKDAESLENAEPAPIIPDENVVGEPGQPDDPGRITWQVEKELLTAQKIISEREIEELKAVIRHLKAEKFTAEEFIEGTEMVVKEAKSKLEKLVKDE